MMQNLNLHIADYRSSKPMALPVGFIGTWNQSCDERGVSLGKHQT